MWTCKQILQSSIQFYSLVQFIFLISYWTLNWKSEFENRNILFMILKIIQYFIHLIFFPRQEDNEKYFKYHIIYYCFMDMYGSFLIEMKNQNLWIILSQIFIGLISLSCYIIYQSLFMILSYLRNLFTCQQTVKLYSLLEPYIIPQFCFALISFNLIRFYDYSSFDLCYMIFRVCQYFITYFILQTQDKKGALQIHYLLDTLMNIFGILNLNNETIFFWLIISQIALGCFHLCLIIFSVILFTILNYSRLFCKYLYFRLCTFVSTVDDDRYIKNFIRLYLIAQLILTIQIIIMLFTQSEVIWHEIIYFFLRTIQYLFHLYVQVYNENFDRNYYYHFTYYFLMDMYGLYAIVTFKVFFWNILFQIILGFILYYWLLIEFISFRVKPDNEMTFNLIETPFENLVISFFMLQVIFSILIIKFNWSESKYYLAFRVIAYGLLLILIKFKCILEFRQLFLLSTIFKAPLSMLFFGAYNFQTQNNFTNLLILTQLFDDLLIIGFIILQCCSGHNHYNQYEIWLNIEKVEIPLKTYIIKDILWWTKTQNIVITEVVRDYESLQIKTKCSICFESLQNGQQTCKLQCHSSHEFHDNCLQQWERYNSSCPICRKQIQKQLDLPSAIIQLEFTIPRRQ